MGAKSLTLVIFWHLIAVFAGGAFGDVDPNLFGWWRFDDGAGSKAENSVEWSSAGMLCGDPTWTDGAIMGALEFDGDGDYVNIYTPRGVEAFTKGSFSIAMWIKVDTRPGMVIGGNGSGVFHMEVSPQGYLTADVNGQEILDYRYLGDGQWHHIALVRVSDPAEQGFSMYIGGDRGANSAEEQTPFTVGQFMIGWHTLGGSFFAGVIDDVRIYTAALSQTQIDDLARCAILPSPQDGEIGVTIDTQLNWTPGNGALSHDVYFGTESPPSTLLADDIPDASWDPGPLDCRTTYYWRVDGNTATGVITGDVWSFTTSDGKATNPQPDDGSIDVNLNVQLNWTPGECSQSSDVWFGTESPPSTLIGDDIESPTIDPGLLEYGVTYYWRVDSNILGETIMGYEWSFEATHWDGSGNASDPYRISDVEGLVRLSEQSYFWSDRGAFFILTDDINIPPEIVMDPIGSYSNKFTHTFDGRDHMISGFTWDTLPHSNTYSNIGLFGHTGAAAQIRNLGLVGAHIASNGLFRAGLIVGNNEGTVSNCYSIGGISVGRTSGSLSMSNEIGGLVGSNKGTIINCYSTVAVSGKKNQVSDLGGLVGRNEGEIANCYSTGSVSHTGSDLGMFAQNLGGLVGRNGGGLNNSYSTGGVSATGESVTCIGGLVGWNEGTMGNCYSIGSVYGWGPRYYNYIGGLVGCSDGTVTASFWDTETSGKTDSAAGTGRTTEKMMQRATFGWSWDFVAFWRIFEGKTYPHLRIEPTVEGDIDGDGDVDFDDFAKMGGNWLAGTE